MQWRNFIFLAAMAACACSRQHTVSTAGWQLSFGDGVDIVYRGDTLAEGTWAEFVLDGDTMKSGNYEHTAFRKEHIADRYGHGVRWTLRMRGDGMPQLVRTFRLYDGFMLTDIALESDSAISTSYMAPLVTRNTGKMIKDTMKRAVFVPYDNDAWIRYGSSTRAEDSLRSYEVTCVYDPEGRKGMVAGAIEHDTWKNAVELTDGRRSMKLFSGVADPLTRQERSRGGGIGSSALRNDDAGMLRRLARRYGDVCRTERKDSSVTKMGRSGACGMEQLGRASVQREPRQRHRGGMFSCRLTYAPLVP